MTRRARPLVTIAISTYNRANGYLKDALQSAVGQTYADLEILVSDNCSTDDTEAVVRAVGDPRIRYIKQAVNIGANNNFNFCVHQARGAYFLLLHDDDLIDADMVEACMDAVHDDTAIGLVRTGTRVIDGQGAVLSVTPNRVGGVSTTDFMLGWFSGQTTLYLCSTLFNTARLAELGGFHSRRLVFQDVAAEMTLAARHGRADVVDVKASFRRHGLNMGSAARLHDWVEDSLFLLDLMCELAPADRRAEVRRHGMVFFSRTNYRHASALPTLPQRLRAYALVHRRFAYAYSPLRYVARWYVQDLKRRIRSLQAAAQGAGTARR
jgi:glycosyltransferase involved in cell wall biosynthesis